VSGRFAGRRALVTGGASGIGLAAAEILAQEGASVAIVYRNAEAARANAARINAVPVVADLADPEAPAVAVKQATKALKESPTLLAHCAGIYEIAPLTDLDADAWDRTMAINLRSALLVGRALAEGLQQGSFVFVSSMAAQTADRTEPAGHYAASKAGLLALVRQMAVEWAPQIRVNAVSPGVIDTPMLRLTDDPQAAGNFLNARVPLGRLGTPQEVAKTIAFLLSDDAAYVTGATIPVDGGVTIT
jgi:NAD(P)-dependent dehydrogenase (short-subunit alcohol dehydrogenase family)